MKMICCCCCCCCVLVCFHSSRSYIRTWYETCLVCLGVWRVRSWWCVLFCLFVLLFYGIAFRISSGTARPRWVSPLPHARSSPQVFFFPSPDFPCSSYEASEYLFRFFFFFCSFCLSFCLSFKFDVSELLTCVCCACRVQYDGISLYTIYCIAMYSYSSRTVVVASLCRNFVTTELVSLEGEESQGFFLHGAAFFRRGAARSRLSHRTAPYDFAFNKTKPRRRAP